MPKGTLRRSNYQLIHGTFDDMYTFEEKVSNAIENGWMLVKGPIIVKNEVHQAMRRNPISTPYALNPDMIIDGWAMTAARSPSKKEAIFEKLKNAPIVLRLVKKIIEEEEQKKDFDFLLKICTNYYKLS